MVKIVVLGAGFSGATAATAIEKAIPSSEVTIVEARKAMIHKFSGLRAATQGDKFSHRTVIPTDNLLKRGKVITANIESATAAEVKLSTGESLAFDYLICATGTRHAFAEPPLNVSDSKDIKEYYADISSAISSASSILVIGGGPVGVELCGEITDLYGEEKKIAIASSGETLIMNTPPFKKKFTSRLKDQLEGKGVEVLLNSKAEGLDFGEKPYLAGNRKVNFTNGNTVECDLVLRAFGYVSSSSIYPTAWLDEQGRIKVSKTLQVEGLDNIFAVGDVNNVKETKMGYFAMGQAKLVSKNIKKIAKNKSSKLMPYKPQSGIMIVPVGKSKGAVHLGPIVLGSRVASALKGKSLLVGDIWKLMGQKQNLQDAL